MKVKCIEKPGEEFIKRDVTIGNVYDVVQNYEDDNDYKLTDDNNKNYYYQKRFFEPVGSIKTTITTDGSEILAALKSSSTVIDMRRDSFNEVYDWCEGYDFYFDIADGEISRIEITDKDADVVYEMPLPIEDEICEILINRFEIL